MLLSLQINQVFVVLLETVIVLVLFYMGFRLIKFAFAKVKSLMTANGIQSLSAFLAFGLTSIIFYNKFTEVAIKLGSFLGNALTNVSSYLIEATEIATNKSELFLASFIQNILTLPFVSFIVFFVTWVFLALTIENLRKKDDDSSKFNQLTNSGQWRYFVFGVLILFGIFLSIASIIAIPIFQEDEQSNNSYVDANERITNEFYSYLEDSSAFYKKFTIELSENQKELLTSPIEGQVSNWNNIVSSSYGMINQYKDHALGRFRSVYEEKLSKDGKNDYTRNLVDWFLGNKSILMDNLNRNRSQISSSINKIVMLESDSTVSSLVVLEEVSKWDVKIPYSDLKVIPPVPTISSGYGFFGFFAGWLLDINNIHLALITGMFGFGLFGATISHIILEKDNEDKVPTLLAVDFLILIIKGLAAAIVIFLAAQGGLLIVSGTQANLNSYIIFFFCFVSAVFSDVVWDWVKTKLTNTLDKSSN